MGERPDVEPVYREPTLKDGRLARVRPVDDGDAEDLVALDLAVTRAGDGVVLTVDQVAADPVEQRSLIEDLRQRNENGDRSEHLVIEVPADGPVRGAATLKQLRPALCRHVAVLAIGVHPLAQGLGAGRALMEGLLEHAERAGLERLELYVRSDNARARRLYESLGFRLEGRRERFVALPGGGYADDLIMARLLAPAGDAQGSSTSDT